MSEDDAMFADPHRLSFLWANLRPRDRARVLRKSPKTLWWFGAGASHHYNLNSSGVQVPLATGFFEAFHALPTSQGFHAHVGPFISFLRDYRGVPADQVHRWTENVEDFMTSVEKEIVRLKAIKAKRRLNREEMSRLYSFAPTFNNMTFILGNVVNEAQNGSSDSLYRYLLDFCGPDDTFITFNWDTLLDRALVDSGGWTPNDGYGVRFASVLDGNWKPRVDGEPSFSANWKLFKLHGSTNWLVPYTGVNLNKLDYVSIVPKSASIFLYWQSSLPYSTYKSRWRGGYAPTCYCYYPPNIPGSLFKQEHLAAPPGKLLLRVAQKGVFAPFDEPDPGGVPSSPVLITPVRQKKYEAYQNTINQLWNDAARMLGDTDKIVVIGYSFPRTDTRARKLLTAALAARRGEIAVDIVAPDAKSVASRIGEQALRKAKSVKIYNMKFDEYIELLASRIPVLMRKAAEEFDEIRNWIKMNYALGELAHRFPQGPFSAKRQA